MKACCGARHAGRRLAAVGHHVRLMPPECVGAYGKAQTNDDRDGEGFRRKLFVKPALP